MKFTIERVDTKVPLTAEYRAELEQRLEKFNYRPGERMRIKLWAGDEHIGWAYGRADA